MKFTKKQKFILCIAFIGVLAFRYLANDTTLFVNADQKVPEGYLPLEDYVLIDGKNGKATTSVKSLEYGDYYDSYSSRKGLETTKGISCRSSWEDLLEAYGDYYADSISASLPYNSDAYVSSENIYASSITLNEFNDKYIKTGKVSLDTHNISVYYSASARLTKVYYTENEQYDLYDADTLLWNFKTHNYQLGISYTCKDDDYNDTDEGIIDYISSDCWSY